MKYCKAIGKGRYYGDITTPNAHKQWQNDKFMGYDMHMMWWWNQKIYYKSAKIMPNHLQSRQQNDTYSNNCHTGYIFSSSESMIIVMMTIIETNNAHAGWTEQRRIHNKHKHNSLQYTGILL